MAALLSPSGSVDATNVRFDARSDAESILLILLATDTQDILFKSMTGDKLGLSLVKVKSVVYDLVPPSH